jgi:hypothetical protein
VALKSCNLSTDVEKSIGMRPLGEGGVNSNADGSGPKRECSKNSPRVDGCAATVRMGRNGQPMRTSTSANGSAERSHSTRFKKVKSTLEEEAHGGVAVLERK